MSPLVVAVSKPCFAAAVETGRRGKEIHHNDEQGRLNGKIPKNCSIQMKVKQECKTLRKGWSWLQKLKLVTFMLLICL
ncbi:hypothetical protein PIB30_055888, partial [Stylosanthes scabra]|nr:hypothetical protein [Stylosanthes scabra]